MSGFWRNKFLFSASYFKLRKVLRHNPFKKSLQVTKNLLRVNYLAAQPMEEHVLVFGVLFQAERGLNSQFL